MALMDPADVPAYSQNQVDAMMLEARNEGAAEALAAAEQDTSAAAAKTLESIAEQITKLGTFHDSIVKETHTEAVQLACLIGSKLARKLMAREPKAEVEAIVLDILRQLGEIAAAPKLVIRVHPVVADDLIARVPELSAMAAFSGEITVSPMDGLGPTDCQVDWAEGGATRDLKTLEAEVKAAVDRYLDAIEAENDTQALPNLAEVQDTPAQEETEAAPEPLEAQTEPVEESTVIDSIVAEATEAAASGAISEVAQEDAVESPPTP